MILVLGSVGLASLLWVFVVSGNIYSLDVEIPIEGRNLPAKKALKAEMPDNALIKLKGTGRALFKTLVLKNFLSDFKLVLDLERISEEYDFYLNDYFERYPQKVVIAPSLEVEYVEVIYPDSIHISLDAYKEKIVTVKPSLMVQPAPGYTLVGDLIVEPSQVQIAGSRKIIESIQFISTISDTLNNAVSSATRILKFELIPNKLVEYTPNQVAVSAKIQPITERIISDVQVLINNIRPDVRVFPSPQTVSLTVIGGADYIANIQPEDIEVSIDFNKRWNPGQTWYEPDVRVPEHVIEWMDLSPRNIELVVTRKRQ
ncbi:MAG: hypothetical protein HOD97_06045 [Candidatus Marinimicrobia bacterium]|nr:hypothetical protein [Candidatus Neomarinimicrobiota bacterium]MBT4281156.1 hypothetical protein [Candidatus Neomarinimicrobiota bacterium]MBT4570080.1 hypothetical protein [Candidatus Neomarinimicrobiota bacterium]MBT4794989.1 hypothetical protein [Candidatus Neomarinimicrobiota bacterium]MBT5340167.1 hypothetical protein [Candidatus Neomarinimicrobiota bacterium]